MKPVTPYPREHPRVCYNDPWHDHYWVAWDVGFRAYTILDFGLP